jgi:hypothetical protein
MLTTDTHVEIDILEQREIGWSCKLLLAYAVTIGNFTYHGSMNASYNLSTENQSGRFLSYSLSDVGFSLPKEAHLLLEYEMYDFEEKIKTHLVNNELSLIFPDVSEISLKKESTIQAGRPIYVQCKLSNFPNRYFVISLHIRNNKWTFNHFSAFFNDGSYDTNFNFKKYKSFPYSVQDYIFDQLLDYLMTSPTYKLRLLSILPGDQRIYKCVFYEKIRQQIKEKTLN